MLQMEINYTDIREDKTSPGKVFIIHTDARRMDDIPRTQQLEVEIPVIEVEAEVVEAEDDFDVDKAFEIIYALVIIGYIAVMVFTILYVYDWTRIVFGVGIIGLFVNRWARLGEISKNKKKQ